MADENGLETVAQTLRDVENRLLRRANAQLGDELDKAVGFINDLAADDPSIEVVPCCGDDDPGDGGPADGDDPGEGDPGDGGDPAGGDGE